jgi:hypothetical protein
MIPYKLGMSCDTNKLARYMAKNIRYRLILRIDFDVIILLLKVTTILD